MDGHICPNCKKPLEDSLLVQELELNQSTSNQQKKQQKYQFSDKYTLDFLSKLHKKKVKCTFKWKRALATMIALASMILPLNKERIASSIAFKNDYTPLCIDFLAIVFCFIFGGISRKKID